MAKKETEVMKVADEQMLATLDSSFPIEQGSRRIMLPRLSMVSQDKTEGKGKAMKVTVEAGTFFAERQTDELNAETKKKIWDKTDLGDSIEGIIIFKRKQLKLYDEATETFTSSPIYDSNDEVVKLYCDKKEVARGTPDELKAKYQYTDKDGKTKSKLEENYILYVIFEGDLYQMNLRGSSMYSFMTYMRANNPASTVTLMSSEAKEKGSINWNQMTFTPVRKLDQDEAELALKMVKDIQFMIASEKAQFHTAEKVDRKLEEEFEKI